MLEERVRRCSIWFRYRIRAGNNEEQLTPAFAKYVTGELRSSGATEEEVRNYEYADPSFMAVSAAVRYWQKLIPTK